MYTFSLALLWNFTLVWVGLIRATNSAVPFPAQLQQKGTIKAFAAELSLSPQNSYKAIQTLNAHIEVLDTASIVASNDKDTLRASLACQIAELVFGRNSQYTDASSDSTYVNKTQVNWSETCWLSPKCFVTPSSTAGVALALKIVRFLNVRFAIRAGGHNANPGFSSVDTHGLLLDLSNLNQRQLSADKKIASIGPGNRWIDVYQYLDSYDVTVVGARVPEVGVGGFMLGGGLSHFSSQFGLACDNVANYEVVLANSTILNANIKEHPDLFYSLKGGGPNYGVVTRFDLETVQYNRKNQVWYEVRNYPASQTESLLQALVDYQNAAAEDQNAGLAFASSQDITTVGFIYSLPTPRPSVFSSFYSIGDFSTAVPSTIGTPAQLTQIYTFAAPPINWDLVTQATGVNLKFYQQAYARYVEIASAMLNATGAVMSFVIQPITKNAVLQSQKRGGNPIGFRAQEQQLFAATIKWTNNEDTEAAHTAVQSLGKAVVELARANGVYLPNVYQNDANYDQSPLASFPAPNVARLKAISLKYDPDQMFQILQNNGFLLSKI